MKTIIMYRTPPDRKAFDAHYFQRHVPLVLALPGLRSFRVSERPVEAADADIYLIAELEFASEAAQAAAFASVEGKLAQRDVDSFASGLYTAISFQSNLVHAGEGEGP